MLEANREIWQCLFLKFKNLARRKPNEHIFLAILKVLLNNSLNLARKKTLLRRQNRI